MDNLQQKFSLLRISTSFIVALLLAVLPLGSQLTWWRPDWILLAMIFFLLYQPGRLSLITILALSLLLDSLTATPLGLHGLCLVVVFYVVSHLHRQIRMFPLTQQLLAILILSISYRTSLLIVMGMLNLPIHDYRFWLPCVTNTLCWPLLSYFLLRKQQKLRKKQKRFS